MFTSHIAFINGKAESACNRVKGVKEIIWTYQKQEITVTKEVRNETKRDFYRKTMLEIHCRKQNDPGIPLAYQSSLAAGQIHVVYLDELTDTSSSIGLEIIQLVVAPEDEAIQTARSLINLVQQADAANSLYLLELVERMLIYKFSTYTRQELEAMFGLTEWRQTRFYQEVKEETKLEAIPRLLKMGLSIEQIAEALELKIEVVQQAIEKQGRKES
ncbi:Rpn family recombination-promoting nuclease/putative transposase [Anabaena sp. WA102]|uniref:Rpn family recombination-promoting nuclease/putative transposase n=1 Tax=Anabaena sp. WA102 TaxID=1647413 RepID=UPI001F3C6399|nr:Rpn family recombination-promoting nuclease/putative transposase [Anabaena sp. WA102]